MGLMLWPGKPKDGWTQVQCPPMRDPGEAFISGDDLRVLRSVGIELDGRRWLHVSCSRASRLPSWEDLRRVKDQFIGKDAVALQVLPRQSDYVNLHPYVLHLWCCLDGDATPDFTRGRRQI